MPLINGFVHAYINAVIVFNCESLCLPHYASSLYLPVPDSPCVCTCILVRICACFQSVSVCLCTCPCISVSRVSASLFVAVIFLVSVKSPRLCVFLCFCVS
jgi:hypothetical protein